MRCPEVRAFLHPFLDGELDVEKNVVVLQHLELCGCCRDRFEGEKRLLVRVREGIAERCPDSLRARMFAACVVVEASPSSEAARGTPLPIATPRVRGRVIPWPRIAASAAAVVIVFLGLDPLCFFGCATVRALTREHVAHRGQALEVAGGDGNVVAASLEKLTSHHVDVPHFCPMCCGQVSCEGAASVKVAEGATMMRFRDSKHGRVFSFIQAQGAHVHPMLRGRDGLYVAHEGDCCFVGWRDESGELCGFVADEPSFPLEQLVALAAGVRASGQHR